MRDCLVSSNSARDTASAGDGVVGGGGIGFEFSIHGAGCSSACCQVHSCLLRRNDASAQHSASRSPENLVLFPRSRCSGWALGGSPPLGVFPPPPLGIILGLHVTFPTHCQSFRHSRMSQVAVPHAAEMLEYKGGSACSCRHSDTHQACTAMHRGGKTQAHAPSSLQAHKKNTL